MYLIVSISLLITIFSFFFFIVMSITINRKLLFGGNGGSSFDDFDVIDFNSGGFGNIKSLNINKVQIHCGDVIDYIQFTYNVLTLDGRLIEIIGNGAGGPGGDYRPIYTFAPGEQLVGINGRVGPNSGHFVITNLEFVTSAKRVYACDGKQPGNAVFNLPVGIMFGKAGFQLDGLGSYGITEPMQITVTETETFSTTKTKTLSITETEILSITKTETISITITETLPIIKIGTSSIIKTETSTAISSISDNSAIAPNSSKIVALSLTTGILGICLLVTIGVFFMEKTSYSEGYPSSVS